MTYTIEDNSPLAPAAKALQEMTTQLASCEQIIDKLNAQLTDALSIPKALTARETLVRDIITSGKSWAALNIPYVFGGEDNTGLDCSGFIQTLYGYYGIKLPRISYQQYTVGVPVDWHGLQPGDLMFFKYGTSTKPVTHVSIFIGNGEMLHTNKPPKTIHVSDAVAEFKSFVGARRVIT